MESSSHQDLSPFIVPPPKPTIYEEFMKNNFELQISNLESLMNLQKDIIASKELELSNQAKKIEEMKKEIDEKLDHSRCIQEIKTIVEKLKTIKEENDSIKHELYECKFKEKHIEGIKDKNKIKDFDRKCVAVEIENLHLKNEIEQIIKKLNP